MEICLIHTPKKALIELQRMYQCGLHAIQPMNQYLSMHLQNFANSLCITTCGSTSFSGVGIVIGVMNDRADNQKRTSRESLRMQESSVTGVPSHGNEESQSSSDRQGNFTYLLAVLYRSLRSIIPNKTWDTDALISGSVHGYLVRLLVPPCRTCIIYVHHIHYHSWFPLIHLLALCRQSTSLLWFFWSSQASMDATLIACFLKSDSAARFVPKWKYSSDLHLTPVSVFSTPSSIHRQSFILLTHP